MIRIRDRMTERVTRERLGLEASRSRRPLMLTLAFAVVAVVALGVVATHLNLRLPWQHKLQFHVAITDALAIDPGVNQVTIAGVPAGKITAARLLDGKPLLSVEIDPKFGPIHRDATLQLHPHTQLQDMALDITSRGTPGSPVIRENETLSADRTQAPVHFSNVLDVFQPITRRRLKATIDVLSQGLADHGERLRAAFVQLTPFLRAATRLTRQLQLHAQLTARLVHNSTLLYAELGARSRQLTGFVVNGGRVLSAVAEAQAPFASILAQLPPTLGQLHRTSTDLHGALDHLTPALASLEQPARSLAPGLRALRDFSSAASPALARLRPALTALAPAARQLQPTAGLLEQTFADLRPSAPRLNQAAGEVPPCETSVEMALAHLLSSLKLDVDRVGGLRGDATLDSNSYLNGPGAALQKAATCSDGDPTG